MKKKTLILVGIAVLAIGCMVGCTSNNSVEQTASEIASETVADASENSEENLSKSSETEDIATGTLEAYYNQPKVKKSFDDSLKTQLEDDTLGTPYSDITVEFKGNECIYSYYFATDFDMSMDGMDSLFESSGKTLLKTMRREAGVPDGTIVSVTYAFYNKSGKELGTFTFRDPS